MLWEWKINEREAAVQMDEAKFVQSPPPPHHLSSLFTVKYSFFLPFQQQIVGDGKGNVLVGDRRIPKTVINKWRAHNAWIGDLKYDGYALFTGSSTHAIKVY